ncbi:MAG: hypothetical protein ACI4P4_04945, partial [Faecousia sp.]
GQSFHNGLLAFKNLCIGHDFHLRNEKCLPARRQKDTQKITISAPRRDLLHDAYLLSLATAI